MVTEIHLLGHLCEAQFESHPVCSSLPVIYTQTFDIHDLLSISTDSYLIRSRPSRFFNSEMWKPQNLPSEVILDHHTLTLTSSRLKVTSLWSPQSRLKCLSILLPPSWTKTCISCALKSQVVLPSLSTTSKKRRFNDAFPQLASQNSLKKCAKLQTSPYRLR